jgi:hypothetical protein
LIAACLRESLCISRAFALLLEQAIYPVSGHKLLATLPVSSQSLDKFYALNFFVGDVVRLGDCDLLLTDKSWPHFCE